ncbi:bet1-like protein At4g14600 isoform X2 [Arachis ipaensis]|uniref:bet1-like protein At4g14600 isoform X2 n=1 Tax=Arachis ipaensis TaxID=130454 RepID=UPI000A2B1F0B|nr:bet1-like protein At4g14600 isoform X2 [Arachis ipaensis]XP_025668013.1 bet1-like protein At4g14600 isoform X2 [Arachis hypogaea]
MASNSHRAAPFYGVAAPFRSRDGLSTRAVSGTDEIQLRIDPFDLEDEITGLHTQVRRLKHVANEIGTEVKYQKDFLEQVVGRHIARLPVNNLELSIEMNYTSATGEQGGGYMQKAL